MKISNLQSLLSKLKFEIWHLITVFAALGLLYTTTVPVFESPDEPWHFNYVRTIAQGHGLPSLLNNDSGAYQEVGQPPLYYLIAGLVTAPFQPDDVRGLALHNPGFGYHAPGTVNDNKNLLVHTERDTFLPLNGISDWRSAVLAIHLARFVSLVFGAITILAVWGLAREVFPNSSLIALASAALVALTPQFVFMSSVTSNDSSAAALSAAALWAIARMWRLGVTPWRTALTGLLVGLASLTKTSTILLGLFAVAAIFLAPRVISGTSVASLRMTYKSRLRDAAVLVAVAVIVGGWWYVRNGLLYGDPLALRVHLNTPWARPAPISLVEVLPSLPLVYRSFWGAFGWGNVEMSLPVYDIIAVVLVASLLGWIISCSKSDFRLWTSGLRNPQTAILLMCVLWCGVILVSFLRWNQQVEAPHGRLLFPMIGAFAVVLVAGLARLPYPRAALGAVVPGFFLLSLITPFVYIRPAYAWPELFPPEQVTSRGSQMASHDLVYGEEARLIGFALNHSTVAPGDWLNVTLCWTAVRPMTHNYTLFVHVLGPENLVIGARNTWPGLGRFPTSLWPMGRAFCDAVPVHVEPWAAVPEVYAIEAGLYDAETDDRLEAANASTGEPAAPPIVGLVRVMPSQPLRVSPQHVAQADFGNAKLIGFDMSVQARPGDTVPLRFYWRATGTLDQDYTVFVHLLDGSGRLVAQADSQPRGGAYPTRDWMAGDVIPDDHTLNLPISLAPGDYVIRTGLYLAPDGPRLPLQSLAGDAFTVGVLRVTP